MGWGSGTIYFDSMVRIALNYSPKVNTDEGAVTPAIIRKAIVRDAYEVFRYEDWDTQQESEYWLDLLPIMHELGEIDDNEFEYYNTGQPDDWDWLNKSF